MTDIFTRTQTALDTLAPIPSGRDVQLDASGNLPDTYLVYSLITGQAAQHADNIETERFYRVQVSIYSRLDSTLAPDVDGAMKAAGFSPSDERELPYSHESRHHGWAKDYTILLNQ